MKILFVLRLYSGFQESVAARRWRPRGAPTIYKLIDSLVEPDLCNELTIVFSRSKDSARDIEGESTIILDGLRADIVILRAAPVQRKWLGSLSWYVGELKQVIGSWRIYRREKPDLVYVDRGNLWSAGFLARFGGVPVIYRVMGVSEGLRRCVRPRQFRDYIHAWLLRSPFSFVICTQDGSGGERVLNGLIDKSVPRKLLINGVDIGPVAPATERSGAETVVSFVGRLEEQKGAREFVEGFLASWQEESAFRAIIIGDGPLRLELEALVSRADASDVIKFAGSIPHDEVVDSLLETDIYVSLNKMGNLSNANLEALKLGLCSIFPCSDEANDRDVETDRLFPEATTVFRLRPGPLAPALKQALILLHRRPDIRRSRAAATARAAAEVIPTWVDRIDSEIEIIRGASG